VSPVADTLAAELGGHAREVPSDPSGTHVIVLPDGRMPLLVRDFGHTQGVCLWYGRSWSLGAGPLDATTLAEIVADTRAWADATSRETVTLYEAALHGAITLSDAFGERWTISFPGVPSPQEAWLHGTQFDAASVGVGRAKAFFVVTRGELASCSERLVATVREQLAAYQTNVALSERVRARAEQLAAKLGERLGIACRVDCWTRPTHWGASDAHVLGGPSELARVFVQSGEVRVHAGLVGDDGWEGSDSDTQFEAIVAAIEHAARTLTIERITVGHRYRVLQSIGELREGMVVSFIGFDDIDNHYGVYEFAGPDGAKLGVGGDYSTPRNSPLGQAHRYLQPVD
jgi:hypothetical protein